MKRTKLTFWIIGFGCGMVTTGMVGVLLSLNISGTDEIKTKIEQEQLIEENPATLIISEKEIESDLEKDINKNQIGEEQSVALEDEKEEQVNQMVDEAPFESTPKQDLAETVLQEVTIPSKVNAVEICEILEDAGIVDSAESFLNFIKEKRKQTQLKSGVYSLPLDADYQTILEELIA